MKLLTVLMAIAFTTAGVSGSAAAVKQYRGYLMCDTTSLPPPAEGMARLVVARDMKSTQDLKPEFVFLDRTPVGMLPQRAVVTAEVPPGWHRVWFGRGSNVQVWMEFVAGGRYLLRLRETMAEGTWRGDLVRESGERYGEFALGKGMKLAVTDEAGRGALERNLGKPSDQTMKQDSLARLRAIGLGTLPIVIPGAWYVQLPSDAPASNFQNFPGKLSLDDQALRFTDHDTTVVEIPRADITDVHLGSQRGETLHPWIKLGYGPAGAQKVAVFADSQRETATENYNRLFAELVKTLGTH